MTTQTLVPNAVVQGNSWHAVIGGSPGGSLAANWSDSSDNTTGNGSDQLFCTMGVTSYTLTSTERVLRYRFTVRAAGPFAQGVDLIYGIGNLADGDWNPDEVAPFAAFADYSAPWHLHWPTGVEVTNTQISKLQFRVRTQNLVGGSTAIVAKAAVELDVVHQPTLTLQQPTGTNPGNTYKPTISWTPAPGDGDTQLKFHAKTFDLAVNAAPSFDDTAGLVDDSLARTSAATSYKVQQPLKNGNYRVRVRIAKDFHGEDWWSVSNSIDFTQNVVWFEQPTNVGPSGLVTTGHPNLQATITSALFGAAQPVHAQWQLARDNVFSIGVLSFDGTEQFTATAAEPRRTMTFTVGTPRIVQGGWWVRARPVDSLGDVGLWSDPVGFITSYTLTATNRTPAQGSTVGLGTVHFAWTPTSTEPSNSQTALRVVVRNAATSAVITDTGKISSTQPSRDITIGTSGNLEWAVTLWDLDDIAGPQSSFLGFSTGAVPTVTVNQPTSPVATATPTVQWTFAASGGATQTNWSVLVYVESTQQKIYDTGLIAGAATSHTVAAGFLQNGVQYRFVVNVVSSAGFIGSGWRISTTAFTPPTAPSGVTATLLSRANAAYNAGPGHIATIPYVRIQWTQTALGANFAYYQIERQTVWFGQTALEDWVDIWHITTESSPIFYDFEMGRTPDGSALVSYRVKVVHAVNGPSSPSGTASVSPVVGSDCNIYLVSNHAPQMSVAYQDRAPYQFATADSERVKVHTVYSPDAEHRPVYFTDPHARGDKFSRSLIVGLTANVLHVGRGRILFRPLENLIHNLDIPYIAVLDGMGQHWYAGVRLATPSYDIGTSKYDGNIEITETNGPVAGSTAFAPAP